MLVQARTSVGISLSVKSFYQKGISADGSFSSFLSLSQDSCPCFPEPVSSLRPNTESEDELATALLPDARDASGPNDSGDGVVQDELLSELTDRGAKLSVLQLKLFPFLMTRGS